MLPQAELSRLCRTRLAQCWTSSRISLYTLLVLFGMLSHGGASAAEPPLAQEDTHDDLTYFEQHVRPLLIERCIQCHGAEKQEGGLRLDSAESLAAGGDSGATIDLEDLNGSMFLAAVRCEGPEMPPSGPLAAEEVLVFEQWVARGAPWPAAGSDDGLALRSRGAITDEDRNYWAFRPLQPVELPATDANHPLDRFLLDRLQSVGLQYAEPADSRTLARRLYLDLVGVPPTPEELNAFLADDQPDAYVRLIERLQSDRRYGEKWSRFWLDLVRYAESDGFNQDAERPTAYLYRDWLIDALNQDLPYDQFVLAQLAGDEVAPDDPQMLAATGFLRHWIYEYNQRDARTQLANIMNDLTDVTGELFFGLGIGCARCHDHKFDPLLQEDYYRLQAAFADFLPNDQRVYGTTEEVQAYQRRMAEWEAATLEPRRRMQELEAKHRRRIADAAYNKFPLDIRPILFKPEAERDGFEQQIAALADRQVQLEWDKMDFTKLLKGEEKAAWEQAAAEVKACEHLRPTELPRILAAGKVTAPIPATTLPTKHKGPTEQSVEPEQVQFVAFHVQGSQPLGDWERPPAPEQSTAPEQRRAALAAWINSPENAVTHRVIVNRIWQELFGVGLVRNANDFGRLGEPPSHPELLDWLANWFIADGKSFKRLQRLLMTSEAYRQSSTPTPQMQQLAAEVDWQNRLLWRFPARRLQAEQIRDSVLVACGCLELMTGGPSKPHDSRVRSVYTLVKRNRPHPLLSAFDVPDRSTSIGGRQSTTTVNQSLVLSNSEWMLTLATEFSQRLLADASEPELHVRSAFERALGRLPEAHEMRSMLAYLEATTQQLMEASAEADEAPPSPESNTPWHRSKAYPSALADVCHVLLNSSEFLYID